MFKSHGTSKDDVLTTNLSGYTYPMLPPCSRLLLFTLEMLSRRLDEVELTVSADRVRYRLISRAPIKTTERTSLFNMIIQS